MRFLSVILFLSVAVAFAPQAEAKSEFVDVIATHLGLRYQPPCRLCHIQGTTGAGTIQTPFGTSILAHGLTSGEGTVGPALDALAMDGTDSDGDGRSDIAELSADQDPNTAVDVPLGPGGPTYGCRLAPGSSSEGKPALAGVLGALVALVLVRRRRGRARQSPKG